MIKSRWERLRENHYNFADANPFAPLRDRTRSLELLDTRQNQRALIPQSRSKSNEKSKLQNKSEEAEEGEQV